MKITSSIRILVSITAVVTVLLFAATPAVELVYRTHLIRKFQTRPCCISLGNLD